MLGASRISAKTICSWAGFAVDLLGNQPGDHGSTLAIWSMGTQGDGKTAEQEFEEHAGPAT